MLHTHTWMCMFMFGYVISWRLLSQTFLSDPHQLTFHLTYILTFYLAFFLAFYLIYIHSDILPGILFDILPSICSGIHSGILSAKAQTDVGLKPTVATSWQKTKLALEEGGRGGREKWEVRKSENWGSEAHFGWDLETFTWQVGKNCYSRTYL